ncbi:asns-2 [Pristionchus pacificus]|uniref:Asparagine synthetase [glutamine-hydrolyzing] n=1 Tax=Pristionchus pacificus TaxID=54126 RepID=A0A2A6CC83_PRIPA|nr:asns-2 [Pristionchus pacificus]|eukprot:PDM75835.1 asns-2 [Pristionchus pacificus]
MCGIFAVCHESGSADKFPLDLAQKHSSRQMHRGPDCRGSYVHPETGDILCHERLAIMDLSCVQPLAGTTDKYQVIHNGEIYNHRALREKELAQFAMRTTCDSEVIVFLYELLQKGELCSLLDGVFAFALVADGDFLAARDPVGVKQMYYGRDAVGRWFFSNEMKCIEDVCGPHTLAPFPPGHFFQKDRGFTRYYQPAWFDHRLCTAPADLDRLRETLIAATTKRLMSDAPIGLLLSGGLDSSLISAIASREMKKLGLAVHSFAVGVDANSPDIVAARKVAAFIGTQHHEVYFSLEDGLAVVDKLVWHLETYDVTSIRASTPMYLLSEYIQKMGIKVVLSGEGSDEIFGGYLYFHNAPSDDEFQKETIDRVLHLHTSDCLRADKSCMAHSIEVRVPFLDKAFLDVAMSTQPSAKRPQEYGGRLVEKYIVRKAFDVEEDPLLPAEILWRQKEQFSDGVGYSWIDGLMQHCAAQVTDEELAAAASLFPHNTPHSKEALYMRRLFAAHFPSDNAARAVRKWIPKWQANQDPSGRASLVHVNSIAKEMQEIRAEA